MAYGSYPKTVRKQDKGYPNKTKGKQEKTLVLLPKNEEKKPLEQSDRPIDSFSLGPIRTTQKIKPKTSAQADYVRSLNSTRQGICLGKGTPVMMYDGSIKNAENIVIGDIIMGDGAIPRIVLGATMRQEELFEVTPVKGDSWVCARSHVLSLVSTSTDCGLAKDQIYDVPLGEYLDYNRTRKLQLKQYRVGVEQFGANKKHLSVNPWLLGLFIGDGNKGSGLIHLNDTSKIGVATKATSLIMEAGYRVACRRETSNHGIALRAYKTEMTSTFVEYIRNAWGVGEIKTHDLYLPCNYKTASKEDRLFLLAGLLDSDGNYDTKTLSFSCVSERLADDFCFVARSIGLAAYKSFRKTNCNDKTFPSFRVGLSGDFSVIPCVRFNFEPRNQIKNVLRTGFSVKSLGIGDCYKFDVNETCRFLLGDFTATHCVPLSIDRRC